jgi:hypothetical protein
MSKILILFIILFFIGSVTQFLLDVFNIGLSFLMLTINIFVILMVVYISYYLFVMLFTKNVNIVERYIKNKKKQPYYALLLTLCNKDYDQASIYLDRLGGKIR